MINIFTTHNLKYTTFDILEDYDVRQGGFREVPPTSLHLLVFFNPYIPRPITFLPFLHFPPFVHSCSQPYLNSATPHTTHLGIKKYSDWPTFPQVYVNGELMGGLDIIKESIENGIALVAEFKFKLE